MRRPPLPNNFIFLTAVVVAVIVYGCLYPFHFRRPLDDVGALHKLFQSWNEWHGRADFLSNVLLYIPFGFFGVLSICRDIAAWKGIVLVVLGGAALSTSVELTQYYDAGRNTAAFDVYWNVLGTGLGALAGCMIGGRFRGDAFATIAENRVPAVLLSAWLGYRLFPYLPTVDTDKFVFVAMPTLLDLSRDTAIWLTVGSLLRAVAGQPRFRVLFPLLALCVLALRVPIAGIASVADIAGAGLAWFWLLLIGDTRSGAVAALLLLAAVAIGQPLGPAAPRGASGGFGWVPLAGYVTGSERDIVTFLQKCFLYGGAIWLLGRAGLGLPWAAALVAAVLLLAAWAQAYLLHWPAETGDAVIALLMAAVMAALNSEHRTKPG